MVDRAVMAIPTRAARQVKGGTRPGLLPATLVLIAVLALTVLLAVSVQRMIDRQIEASLVLNSEALVTSIEAGMQDVDQHLSSFTGLFEASDDVTLDEYRRFMNEVGLASGVRGMGYAPILPRSDLEAFQKHMAETTPGYEVFEIDADGNRVAVGPRDVYFPIQYFDPADTLGQPLGLDVGSPPGRLEYVMESVASGHAVATPLVPLATTGEEGFIVYHPVEGPSGAAVGLVIAPLVLNDVVSEWEPVGLTSVLSWTIRDVTDAVLAQGGSVTDDRHSSILPPVEEGVAHSDTVNVAGRLWQIDTMPAPGSMLVADTDRGWWILLTGLIMGLLAAAAVYAFSHRAEVMREVASLSDAINAKNQFIAAVAHKLGTPLTSVLGFAEVLRDQGREMAVEEQRELIEALADEAATLGTIHEDLVVMGRAEYGILKVEAVPIDVGPAITAVLEALDLGHDVPVKISDSPHRVIADPGKLRQVLRNLLTNAATHGGPNVYIVVESLGDVIVIDVVDDGEGIPADRFWNIFEPYLPSSDPATGNPQPMALGLSVSKALALRMRGDLTYRRCSGRTVFELTIPAEDPRTDGGTINRESRTRTSSGRTKVTSSS